MGKLFKIFVILTICCCLSAPLALAEKQKERVNTIHTDGTAKIWVAPDRARLFLGVETQHESLEGARQLNAETMNRIMSRLQSLDIKDLLSQSPSYTVSLIKEEEHVARKEMRLQRIIGYKVTQKFTVLIRSNDIETLSNNAGLVLDTALQSGVNIIEQNILFFKEDISKDKEEVLKLALRDAISRANVIADTADMTIKEYSSIRSGFTIGFSGPRYSQNYQQIDTQASEGTASTIMAAKIPVEASVSLSCIME